MQLKDPTTIRSFERFNIEDLADRAVICDVAARTVEFFREVLGG
jgi:hypothetical protein